MVLPLRAPRAAEDEKQDQRTLCEILCELGNLCGSSCAWIAMITHRIAANHQVFNPVRVEKSQEISEVWM